MADPKDPKAPGAEQRAAPDTPPAASQRDPGQLDPNQEDRPRVQTLAVTPAEAGQKLLQYLSRRTGQPDKLIHKWVRTGQVRVDKARAKPFQRLDAGQMVRIPPYRQAMDTEPGLTTGARFPEPTWPDSPKHSPGKTGPASATTQSASPQPAQPRSGRPSPGLDIIYEDDQLMILAKPAGLPSQGGTGHADSVAARLRSAYAGTDFLPTLAHRLDRDTSGLLAVGKTYAALRALQECFADKSGTVAKTYLAWVAGEPGMLVPGAAWDMADRLEKSLGPDGEKVRVVNQVRAGSSKSALARARCLRVREGYGLLALELVTGRTHQLRVQLAERGLPIVGDLKYGGPASPVKGAPLLLHAARLALPRDVVHAGAPIGSDLTFTLRPPWPEPWDVPPNLIQELEQPTAS